MTDDSDNPKMIFGCLSGLHSDGCQIELSEIVPIIDRYKIKNGSQINISHAIKESYKVFLFFQL